MTAPAERLRTDPAPEALEALERRCFGEPWDAALLAALLSGGHGRAWLLEAAGEPVAFALLRQVADEAELLRIGVPSEHRRQGYGRALLAHVLAWARDAGVARLFLEVRSGNAAARALYARAGFRAAGVRPGYYRDPPEDALLLEWRPGPR